MYGVRKRIGKSQSEEVNKSEPTSEVVKGSVNLWSGFDHNMMRLGEILPEMSLEFWEVIWLFSLGSDIVRVSWQVV